jgi:tyramine---L-glutamate ligase
LIKLFVYEYLTGGGIDPDLAGEGSLADLSTLIVEGRAMRDALVADLLELDGVQVTFASSRFEHVDGRQS